MSLAIVHSRALDALRSPAVTVEVHLANGLPGVTLSSSPDNYSLYDKLQMSRFDGKTWEPIGPVIAAGAPRTN